MRNPEITYPIDASGSELSTLYKAFLLYEILFVCLGDLLGLMLLILYPTSSLAMYVR